MTPNFSVTSKIVSHSRKKTVVELRSSNDSKVFSSKVVYLVMIYPYYFEFW